MNFKEFLNEEMKSPYVSVMDIKPEHVQMPKASNQGDKKNYDIEFEQRDQETIDSLGVKSFRDNWSAAAKNHTYKRVHVSAKSWKTAKSRLNKEILALESKGFTVLFIKKIGKKGQDWNTPAYKLGYSYSAILAKPIDM